MIVVDTHAWLWWVADDPKLSERASSALAGAEAIGVPAVCCWEVAWLRNLGKITIKLPVLEWLDYALGIPGVKLLPQDPVIAERAATLGRDFPRDPCDRLIAATAIQHVAPLVTRDGPITESGLVQTIW